MEVELWEKLFVIYWFVIITIIIIITMAISEQQVGVRLFSIIKALVVIHFIIVTIKLKIN